MVITQAWHPLWAMALFKRDLDNIRYRESFVSNATFHDTRGVTDSALDLFLFARRY